MDYIIHYDVAAVFIEIILSLLLCIRRNYPTEANKGYGRMLLRATLQMLKELNKKIVVEGVENEEMRDTLIEMGCDFLQGYHYSKPLIRESFTEYIKAYKAGRPIDTAKENGG